MSARRHAALLVLLALAQTAAAQITPSEAGQRRVAPQAATDLFGRTTPRLLLLVLTLAWLARRLLTLGFARARSIAWGRDRTSTQSPLLFGERLLKAMVILVAIFVILTLVGVDTKTALAGVGIGGIALALGAQRTVENLLGGIFLLTDKAIAVGDLVSTPTRVRGKSSGR